MQMKRVKENVVVVSGKLRKCRKETKTFKGKKGDEKLYITLADADLNDEDMQVFKEAYKSSGEKFTPSWIKEYEGFVNLSTVFDVPVKVAFDCDRVFDSALEYTKEYDFYNADVQLSIIIKEGALYPRSMIVESAGEPYDQFADFD